MTTPALELAGIHKSFGALAVSRDVSLALPRGARHALIGPNGAGKTTLVHMISGVLRPTAGTVRLAGQDVTRLSPEARVRRGLIRTFQISSLFDHLTVAENIALALSARHGLALRPWGRLTHRQDLLDEAAALLRQVRLLPQAAHPIVDLAYGQRRLVEIALALAMRPSILVLDEPAAGLAAADREMLLRALLELPSDLTVLIIEHDMNLVFRLAERLTVLVRGEVLVEGTVAEIRADPRVREVYLGTRRHD
jgi:branched-chain amino acid transport system ATP-binding protein